MKIITQPSTTSEVTLQDVLDRLASTDFGESRRRDLRSAVTCYARLVGKDPASIPLQLAEFRRTLDSLVPAEAGVSRKRWANFRSDLAAAVAGSGLVMMLNTKRLPVDPVWENVLAAAPQRVRWGLSRFARWASLRCIRPEGVSDGEIERFVTELELGSFVRDLHRVQRRVAQNWNALVRLTAKDELKAVAVPSFRHVRSTVLQP
jgi:hypothetical protein